VNSVGEGNNKESFGSSHGYTGALICTQGDLILPLMPGTPDNSMHALEN
jgi:hypothetical protein